ncbi:uncharacterized protein LOC102620999 isoform X2 [Citrus sinensis]|uniref:uncharacterized protein LOC102620999 isoform X2 n=1 Tax=Citrus sinensis TaxID=2711 RepID=UPI002279645E|nr:uncharacterized protein LOC102620999 isoform X2 [Citrus sinensis]
MSLNLKLHSGFLSLALPYYSCCSTPRTRHLRSRNQTVPAIRCAKRTGKQRYPSEKKKLKQKHKQVLNDVNNKFEGFWRLSKLAVPVHKDPGKDFIGVSHALLDEITKVLEFPVASMLPAEAFTVVRKSFDARKVLKEPKFVYTVDMDVSKLLDLEPRTWDFISRLEAKVGSVEHMLDKRASGDLINIIHDCKKVSDDTLLRKEISSGSEGLYNYPRTRKPKVAVVGGGPSGLFASLVLAELGADVTLIERGQAVEQRGRDIGALVVRRMLEMESNFCFGEGGAGTWSDGKLVTRIGRNSNSVLAVMNTLVHFGAPANILVDGKPHLGTDRLIPLLRNFRQHLQRLGVGLRMEHPQELINSIQYSELATEVQKGRGKVPVADYKVAKYVSGEDGDALSGVVTTNRSCYSFCMCPGGQIVLTSTNPLELCINGMSFSRRSSRWANAALVVTVSAKDFDTLDLHGPLAGVKFQREFEQRAAIMGGGNFVVPAQKVTDFLENKLSASPLPPSSYRLGVKAASLHELFPTHLTDALKHSISMFDEELPGFISDTGLLHGVETRTSCPLQIPRNNETCESTSLKGLYPVGEGAGYAGGIVSAAADGMYAGFAVAKDFGLFPADIESILGKAQAAGFAKY